jgi:hypothetical protein
MPSSDHLTPVVRSAQNAWSWMHPRSDRRQRLSRMPRGMKMASKDAELDVRTRFPIPRQRATPGAKGDICIQPRGFWVDVDARARNLFNRRRHDHTTRQPSLKVGHDGLVDVSAYTSDISPGYPRLRPHQLRLHYLTLAGGLGDASC